MVSRSRTHRDSAIPYSVTVAGCWTIANLRRLQKRLKTIAQVQGQKHLS